MRLSALTRVYVTTRETEMITKLAHVVYFIASYPLTATNRTEAFVRFASFQLKARLSEEVIVPWIEGTKLAVQREMTGATLSIYASVHGFSEMASLLHLLQPGDYFCDVVTNVGSYTVLASGVCRAQSTAFEPDPCATSAISRREEVNGLVELVTIHESAVGAVEDVANFTTELSSRNHVLINESSATRQVHLTTGDSISTDRTPVQLKIDFEGFKRQVFQGVRATLALDTLKAITIEWQSEVTDTLLSLGFSRVRYAPLSRELGKGTDRDLETNTLFSRDPRFVECRVADARRFGVVRMEL